MYFDSNFFYRIFTLQLVHAQSTGSPRTLMSLSTVLASFFPPRGTPMEWNPEYNWQPIPIFTEPLENDMVKEYSFIYIFDIYI